MRRRRPKLSRNKQRAARAAVEEPGDSMSKHGKSWISDWNPEDPTFWQQQGKRIARRNLIWSIFAENIGFSVWMVWSVVAARLPMAGFSYTTDQLFQLV